jgi:hypothetical protein
VPTVGISYGVFKELKSERTVQGLNFLAYDQVIVFRGGILLIREPGWRRGLFIVRYVPATRFEVLEFGHVAVFLSGGFLRVCLI